MAAAILLALTAATYACIWIHYIQVLPQSVIGVAFGPFSPERQQLDVVWVARNLAADRAGLSVGDHILAINGQPVTSLDLWVKLVPRGAPGSTVVLTIADRSGNRGDHAVRLPIPPSEMARPTMVQAAVMQLLLAYPLFFLAVGMAVLFLRLEDRNAWLLAIMFAGFIGLAGFMTPESESLVPIEMRRFALVYLFTARDLLPTLFYWFFAVFPVRSPLDRKAPWLKFLLVGTAMLLSGRLVLKVAATASYASVLQIIDPAGRGFSALVGRGYGIGAFVLGLVSLTWNGLRAPSAEAARKVRVLVGGTLIGIIPLVVFSAVVLRSNTEANPMDLPFWLWAGVVLALMLVPSSFAYAVFKHRVMEIPVLLKRSARYLLVRRGFALFIVAVSALAAWAAVEFFSGFFTGWFGAGPRVILTAGMTAAGFGSVLALAGARVQRGVRDRLDRAFFRSAYDARQILEDLAQRIRGAGSCAVVAALLEQQIGEALHPSSLTVYIAAADGSLGTDAEGVPAELRTLPRDLPALQEAAARSRPCDVPTSDSDGFAAFSLLRPLRPECLVPLSARDSRLVGAIVLGERLSEEPYSSEDKRLLASVASQSGLAIESIRLAEAMAERIEKERRASYEMETARLVQTRLLFQHTRPMRTLEYAGRCVQARAVGGDYYDFLDLGEHQIALALADVSGKGLPAALLMASVQATLRTHSASGTWNLSGVTSQLNRLLYESTAPEHYVTLFLGEYDDATRRLQYVNCGHNPPILLKREGEVRRLEPTARVVGAFREWQCVVEQTILEPGDLIAVFTDGITEAVNPDGMDFGEERLIDTLRNNSRQPLPKMLDLVIRTVQDFGAGEQADDLTLILGVGRI